MIYTVSSSIILEICINPWKRVDNVNIDFLSFHEWKDHLKFSLKLFKEEERNFLHEPNATQGLIKQWIYSHEYKAVVLDIPVALF